MYIELRNNVIVCPRYKVSFKQSGRPQESYLETEREKDDLLAALQEDNAAAASAGKYIGIDTEERFYVQMSVMEHIEDYIQHWDIEHGQWKKYVFRLEGVCYNADERVLLKYGSGEKYPVKVTAQIRGARVWATDSPGAVIEYRAPDDVGDWPQDQKRPENGIWFIKDWFAIALEADTSIIPEGTGSITVEVDMKVEDFPLADTPSDVPVTDIEVQEIDQSGAAWAEGEQVVSYDAAVELLEKNKGRWKSRMERVEYLLGQELRAERKDLLDRVDIVHCNALNVVLMTDEEKAAWQAYKQELRDLPLQAGFPNEVVWPERPGG
jgi:hypothetical protein